MANIFRWLILALLPDFLKGAELAKQDIDEAFREGHAPEDVYRVAMAKRRTLEPAKPPAEEKQTQIQFEPAVANRVKAINGPPVTTKKRR